MNKRIRAMKGNTNARTGTLPSTAMLIAKILFLWKYGRSWKQISEEVGRSKGYCQNRFYEFQHLIV